MTTREYDPQKVQIILGAAPITGFAAGTYVSIEQDEASFETVVGADGEVARARRAARTGTMTLTLMHTSIANAILTGLHASDVIFPVLVKDGANVVVSGEAWVEMPAAFERGVEVGDSEWTIKLAKVSFALLGNP